MEDPGQGFYEIRIKGHLDERRLIQLPDMSSTPLESGETLIKGPVKDQPELQGLLSWIGDLGTTLVSVRRIDTVEDDGD